LIVKGEIRVLGGILRLLIAQNAYYDILRHVVKAGLE